MSGISDIGGAAGDIIGAGGFGGKKKLNSDLTPKQEFIKNNPEVDLAEQKRLAEEAIARMNQGN